jgi:tyrosine type site-specific recombinase
MINKVMLTMESRIHGDMYVRFGGRLVETYHRKVEKRCWPSLLKELGELAEINEPVRETYYKGNERIDEVTPKYALLTTHAGRRTFICNALALGIPAQVVMKWTGHSDYKAMKPYIDIADDIKANAMNKFNQL